MSPERRGKPRKDQQASQTESQTEQTAETTDPINQIAHKYMRAIYKEGGDPLSALSTAQDDLLSATGVLESFRALHSLAGLGVEEARERGDQSLIDTLTKRQRAFSSALRRLGESSKAQAGDTIAPVSTNPSNLPPMTGRKG